MSPEWKLVIIVFSIAVFAGIAGLVIATALIRNGVWP